MNEYAILTNQSPSSFHFRIAAGIVGLAAVCGIGAYKFRNRGGMSTSVFLMQLRVAAQGTVVGALSIGLAYTMVDKYILHPVDKYKTVGPPPTTTTDSPPK